MDKIDIDEFIRLLKIKTEEMTYLQLLLFHRLAKQYYHYEKIKEVKKTLANMES